MVETDRTCEGRIVGREGLVRKAEQSAMEARRSKVGGEKCSIATTGLRPRDNLPSMKLGGWWVMKDEVMGDGP